MNPQYKLGRIVNHDPRSLNFAFDTSNIVIKDVEHVRYIPILNQGDVGACTGNAGIGIISTAPFLNTLIPYTRDEAGALKLYADAEKLDGGIGYPPEDVGSSGLSIAKVLLKNGLISSYQHTFTLNDALKALQQYPIMVGIPWYENMFTPDADGRVHPTGTYKGGHEVEGYKVDCENGRIWFHNSWGTSWGMSGDFYLTWFDFATLLAQQGDVVVLLPVNVTPTPITKPMQDYPMIDKWCAGAQEYEGWTTTPPSRSCRNNNPGNIRFSHDSIFSVGAHDDGNGFCVYPDYQTGLDMLKLFFTRACTGKSSVYSPMMNLTQFYALYAPSTDSNNPYAYANWIAVYLGVSPEDPISSFVA